ncbi:hypothetical protein A9G34_00545 [Gilliamella sp. Choc4-2]|nr:hypothetical protein A9G33_03290 [Gilliamella apicola]OCG46431.1 hypothetical protein A9G34_00545 [Gilliamella apicola]OCG53788.1 hypothetical protein A9G36_09520 [Gilliamella apicola]OCG64332.1 hypothetical protein A9G48_03370 [Gilliamella apicola]
MIQLTDKDYISKGLHRKCYHHPDDPNKCIKINYNEGAEQETNREIAYYKHLIKRNISWNTLAKYYGPVQTSLGEGQLFELIRDYDGKISTSLDKFFADEQLTKQHYDELVASLRELKSELLQNRIITMTIKSKNILFQRVSPNQNRLIIIDNIGNSTFIPVSNYISFFATAKIERKWQQFLKLILHENWYNPELNSLVARVNR